MNERSLPGEDRFQPDLESYTFSEKLSNDQKQKKETKSSFMRNSKMTILSSLYINEGL